MDCLTIGNDTVSFDGEGALIARNRPRIYYRISAATATNVIDFVRHHRDICCAMMNNRPEELAGYKVRDVTKDDRRTLASSPLGKLRNGS